MAKRPFAWSASRLAQFEICPRRHHEADLLKRFPEEESPEQRFGSRLHKALEDYCRSEGEIDFPHDLRGYRHIGDKVKALPGRKFYEVKLGLTADFKPTQFFAKDVWFRCVTDVLALAKRRAAVLDYKTGKVKPEQDQLELNALAVFAHYPSVDVIDTRYWWLTKGEGFTSYRFTRDKLQASWHKFLPRVSRYREAYDTDKFPPRPCGLCRNWCPVKTCTYNGV